MEFFISFAYLAQNTLQQLQKSQKMQRYCELHIRLEYRSA
jgi:hypothetical protein